jgi:hypothetical protein
MRCPLQNDFESRLTSIGYCHYALVVDRFENGVVERGWEIQDRPYLENRSEPPWYVGPEIRYAVQAELFANPAGPHPSGMYMTTAGPRPE